MKYFSRHSSIPLFIVFAFLSFFCLLWFRSSLTVSSDRSSIHTAINRVAPNVVMILSKDKVIGAGIILDPEKGIVLTSKHLFASGGSYFLRTQYGQTYSLENISFDSLHDLAVGRIVPDVALQKLSPTATLLSQNTLQRGDEVVSFGTLGLNQSIILSGGIISDTHQKVTLNDTAGSDYFIQTDVNAESGFSGGPLINIRGELIGINTAVLGVNTSISWSTPVTEDIIATLKQTLK